MFNKVSKLAWQTNNTLLNRLTPLTKSYYLQSLNHRYFVTKLMMSDDQKLFKSIGLKASTLKNIQKNESIATALKACINEVNRL